MTIACQTVTVVTPANITTTLMTLDQTSCAAPCSVIATIKWTNNGGSSGMLIPGVTVDGGVPQTLAERSVAPGATATVDFLIIGLTAGSHSICPSPN